MSNEKSKAQQYADNISWLVEKIMKELPPEMAEKALGRICSAANHQYITGGTKRI